MSQRSSVARLQQLATAALLALALTWLATQWGVSPPRAAAGALLIVFGHAIFLAFEFILMRRASVGDPAPAPTFGLLVRAWWRETWQDVRVFAWRQPFRWRAVPDFLPSDARGRRAVVFIHGFACNRGFWSPWMKRLRRLGHPFVAVNLEPLFGSIDAYGPIIDDAVRRVSLATGLPPVLVCHSMGGLAARAWLRQARDASRTHHIVTIGTPHQGTCLARFSRATNGREMRPDSLWLAALRAAEATCSSPPFTCWFSNCDNVVFPPRFAVLPDASNRLLPGAAHVDLAFRPQVLAHVLHSLSGGPIHPDAPKQPPS